MPSETAESKSANQEMADGLRQLADWLEANPQQDGILGYVTVNCFLQSREALLAHVKGLGRLEKDAVGNWFYFRKRFTNRVSLEFNIDREKICRKVVTKTVLPAEPARIIPALPEREEEIVTWECPDSVLADPGAVELGQ